MSEYNPDHRSSPWDTLIEWAEEQREQDAPMTGLICLYLGALMGPSVQFWLRREMQYRSKEAQHE